MNRKRQFQDDSSASSSLAEKFLRRSAKYDSDEPSDDEPDDLDNELGDELNNQLMNSLDQDLDSSSSEPPASNENSEHSNGFTGLQPEHSDESAGLQPEHSNEFANLQPEVVLSPNNESVKGFLFNEESKYEYNAKRESQFITLNEHVNWLYNNHASLIEHLDYPESTFEQLDLDRQYEFVDAEIYDAILKCKSALNQFSKDDIRRAKSQSNPFESIAKCCFQNRSALKMANLDWLCNGMFTAPRIEDKNDRLNFVDLCGGPGE